MSKEIAFVNSQVRLLDSIRISLPFNPTTIPICDGLVCIPASATAKHYATICFDHKNKRYSIFEYNELFRYAFEGYSRRRPLVESTFILARDETSKLRIGISSIQDECVFAEDFQEAKRLNSLLLDFYIRYRLEKKVFDI